MESQNDPQIAPYIIAAERCVSPRVFRCCGFDPASESDHQVHRLRGAQTRIYPRSRIAKQITGAIASKQTTPSQSRDGKKTDPLWPQNSRLPISSFESPAKLLRESWFLQNRADCSNGTSTSKSSARREHNFSDFFSKLQSAASPSSSGG